LAYKAKDYQKIGLGHSVKDRDEAKQPFIRNEEEFENFVEALVPRGL
jgi:hypothetical protein